MNAHPSFQTEIDFELPKGYADEQGTLHRHGVMRLATAADEILPLRDPRVQQNEAYLAVIVLARVVVRLGTFSPFALVHSVRRAAGTAARGDQSQRTTGVCCVP